jgi:WD40 repeat protein
VGRVTLCDARTGEARSELRQHVGIILALAFSPDGRRLVATGQDQKLRVWDVATGTNLTTLRGHKWDVRALAFSPDGTRLASAGHDNTIKIWDMAALTELTTLKGHQSVISTVAFTPDGRTLLSAGDDTVRFWNVATWREVGNLKPPVPANLLVLSPAATCFAVADAIQQGPLHFWRVPALAEVDGTPERAANRTEPQ